MAIAVLAATADYRRAPNVMALTCGAVSRPPRRARRRYVQKAARLRSARGPPRVLDARLARG